MLLVFLEDKTFFRFGTLFHHKKCVGLGLFVEPCSLFWECVISFLLICFICLNEINLWACVALLIFYAQLFLLSSLVELCCIDHLLIWFFDTIWTTNVFWDTSLCLLESIGVFSKLCLLWFLKVLYMHIYYVYILWHAYFLWSNT